MQQEIAEELARLYADLDAEIAQRAWRCRACGACCHFAAHGHELFCTALEAEFLAGDEAPDAFNHDVCPFLDDARCTRRDRRTLACRVYHCEASPTDAMSALSEAYLGRLKVLHERFGVRWRYAVLSEHFSRRNILHCKD